MELHDNALITTNFAVVRFRNHSYDITDRIGLHSVLLPLYLLVANCVEYWNIILAVHVKAKSPSSSVDGRAVVR